VPAAFQPVFGQTIPIAFVLDLDGNLRAYLNPSTTTSETAIATLMSGTSVPGAGGVAPQAIDYDPVNHVFYALTINNGNQLAVYIVSASQVATQILSGQPFLASPTFTLTNPVPGSPSNMHIAADVAGTSPEALFFLFGTGQVFEVLNPPTGQGSAAQTATVVPNLPAGTQFLWISADHH
jgi:hypothetical protein